MRNYRSLLFTICIAAMMLAPILLISCGGGGGGGGTVSTGPTTTPPTPITVSLSGVGTVTFPSTAFSGTPQVNMTTSTSADTEQTFEDSAYYVSGPRLSYEIRINTGSSYPAADSTLTINVPSDFVSSLPAGSSIQALADLEDSSDEEVQDGFEVLSPSQFDASNDTLTVTLPVIAFIDNGSGFEAVVTLAPVLGTQNSAPAHVASTTVTSCQGFPINSPLDGTPVVTGPHGTFNPPDHKGIDYHAADGDPVFAAADGIVVVAHFQQRQPCTTPRCSELGLTCTALPCPPGTGRSGGNVVVLQHTDPTTGQLYYTKYMHLKDGSIDNLIQCLQQKNCPPIHQGDQIGEADSTGGVTGPHLHFEYRLQNGQPINPDNCINPAPAPSPIPSNAFDGTYNVTRTACLNSSCDNVSGQFVVQNGVLTQSDGVLTGTIDASGNFTGTFPGSSCGDIPVTGTFTTSGLTLQGAVGVCSVSYQGTKI